MAVETVLAQVAAICRGISGVAESSAQGWPDVAPLVRAPVCYVEARAPQFSRLTSGAAGAVEMRYTVLITLVLGGPDLSAQRALALAAPFFARFRDAFYGDPTLGGSCWHSALDDGEANLREYRRSKAFPRIAWRLQVTELAAADGGAVGLVAGPGAYVAIGAAGAEQDISAYCAAAAYVETTAEHDVTPYGATAESKAPGLSSAEVRLHGKWTPALNEIMAGLRRVAGRSIVLGPAGNGDGMPKISAAGYLRDYAVETDATGGAVGWRALFRASGGFEFDVF